MPKSGYERPSPIHKMGDLPPNRMIKTDKPTHNLHAQDTNEPGHYRANSGMPVHRPKLS